jgi:8-oxo-dGTP pyrophosphatase MutT (NUDIX family)
MLRAYWDACQADSSTAALRELHEETGFGSGKAGEGNAAIRNVSPVLVKDPGWVWGGDGGDEGEERQEEMKLTRLG